MAEEKKDDKKGGKKPDKKDDKKPEKKSPDERLAEVTGELIVIALVLYLLSRVFGLFGLGGGASGSAAFSFKTFFDNAGLTPLFDQIFSTYVFLISILSTLFIMGIIYCVLKLHTLETTWKNMINPTPADAFAEKPKNPRWQRVVVHISSDNASDWRLAILECDIILDELLDKLGYFGGTIGDKLKNATTAEFRTLNNAWEAHKIRNAIAHEGQDFTLTQREARRIVSLYETVFREFDFI